jgi:peroxiredoxin
MRLKPGQKAPQFKTYDIGEEIIDLEALKGSKVLLSFYRYASCPLCNLRVHKLIQLFPELSANGLKIISIFQSLKESILQYVGKQDAPFPIVSDPSQKLYKLYGVETSWMGFAKGGLEVQKLMETTKLGFLPGKMEGDVNRIPADFLIDENGVIQTAYYGKDISDHLDESEIAKFIGL